MSLNALVPAMAVYGFIGAYYTHSIGFPATILVLLWYMTIVVATYRDEIAAALLITLNLKLPLVLLVGVLLGFIYAWALRFVPLLRWEPWTVGWRMLPPTAPPAASDDPVGSNGRTVVFVRDGAFTWFALSAVAIVAGIYFIAGSFEPEVSGTLSLVIGMLLAVIGITTLLYAFFRWWRADHPSYWLDAIFALSLLFLALVPLLYSSVFTNRALALLLFYGGLTLVVVLSAAAHIRFFWYTEARLQMLLANDVRAAPSQAGTARILLRWLTLWLVVAALYIAATTADSFSGGNFDTVFLTTLIVALLLALLGLLIGFVQWRREHWLFYSMPRIGHVEQYFAQSEARPQQQQQKPTNEPLAPQVRPRRPPPQTVRAAAVAPNPLNAFQVQTKSH